MWSASVRDPDATPPNVAAIYSASSIAHLEELHNSGIAGIAADCSEEDLRIYEESVHYLLYQRYHPRFRISAKGKCGVLSRLP